MRQADESFQTTRKLILRLQVPVPGPGILSFDGYGKPPRGRIIAAAARARIVRQAAGLEEPEPLPGAHPTEDSRKHIPTLGEFQSTFDEWVGTAKAEQKGTVKFYRESYQKLLDYGPWSHLTLAEIEEPEIEAFKAWALKQAGRRRNGKRTPVRRPR